MMTIAYERLPVLIDGVRTPFLDSAGAYSTLMSYELAAKAIAGLVDKTGVKVDKLGLVAMGTVLHEINTTNVARESMLAAGLPSTIPAYTVAMAGISPNIAVANICDMIALGRLDAGIAGGVDNFSDVPVRLSQNIRRSLMKIRQSRSGRDRLAVLASLRPRDLLLDIPTSSDFTTKLTMGAACEAMVSKFGTTRAAGDAFAAASHARAIAAADSGIYQQQIVPVSINHLTVDRDNSARRDATNDTLARLKPVFDREHGVITAGNASRFSDGAGALLLSSMAMARAAGHSIKAVIRDYQLAGVQSLETEMLLGPAMTIPRLLKRNGLRFDDIEVWEIHEAFAAQVLINCSCMASREFVSQRLGADFPFGKISLDQLNIWGGSLALGNPFAATGVRLFQTAAQRLQMFNQRYAVISTCAGGGLGAAFLLENPAFIEHS